MAELSVQIGADVRDLLKKLDLTEKQFKRLEKISTKSGTAISKVGATASKGITKMGKASANAVPAVTEFSRVIQDAPFGIQGIANNITQLTQNFGYLSKKVGGSTNALKAMLATLTGPAGVLLIVSAVTSLMVSYGDKIQFSTDSLHGLAKATAEYLAKAKAEITTLNQLVKISTDESNSKEVRQKAIDNINKNYSKYLGNLDLESIKTDAVSKSINNLIKSLILKAKVDGLQDLISEKTKDSSEKLIKSEIERDRALSALNKSVDKAIKGNFVLNQAIGDVKGSRNRLKALSDLTKQQGVLGENARQSSVGVRLALASYREADESVKDLGNTLDGSLKPLIKLQEQFRKGLFQFQSDTDNIDENAVLIVANTKKINNDKSKAYESYAEKRRKLFDKLAAEEIKQNEETINELIKQYSKLEVDVDPFDGSIIDIESGFKGIVEVEDKIKNIQKLLRSFGFEGINLQGLDLEQLSAYENKLRSVISITNVFSDATSNAFKELTTSISSTLETGNVFIDGFVSSIIASLGRLLSEMAATLVAEKLIGIGKNQVNRGVSSGNAITVATSAAASLGPAGVFALPGLIASQLALVNGAFAGVSAFAKGGFSGDDNLAFLNKNELVLRPMEQAALYNAIRGRSFSSIGSDGSNSNNPMGDNIIGTATLRGSNQYIQLKRSKRKMNRFFSS